MTIKELLATENPIYIYSGEGIATPEVFEGKRTILAIKRRLTKERCNGDRIAWAVVYAFDTEYGFHVGVDIETGEYRSL